MPEGSQRASWRKRWLNIGIAIVILAGIAYWVDLSSVAEALLSLPASIVFAALILATCDRFLMAYKWRHLVVAGGTKLRFPTALRIHYQSVASGRVIPAPLAADVLRAYLAAQAGVPGGLVVSSLLLEKIIAMLSSIVVALIGLYYLGGRLPDEVNPYLFSSLAVIALVAGLGSLILVLLAPAHQLGKTLLGRVTKRWPLPARVSGILGKVSRSLLDYRQQGAVLVQNSLLALFEIGLQLAKLSVIAIGLGITTDGPVLFAILAIALFVRRIAGVVESWGLGEGSAVLIVVLLGIEPELAVALFVANFATTTIAILPGALLFYTHPIAGARAKRP